MEWLWTICGVILFVFRSFLDELGRELARKLVRAIFGEPPK